MSSTGAIKIGTDEQSIWVQVIGKGNFNNSPSLKAYIDACIDQGWRNIVIDLGGCTAMDSTFMGTLASFGMRLRDVQGSVFIADASDSNQKNLQGLGLHYLMVINPSPASWDGRLDLIRASCETSLVQEESSAEHVLEAHETLCDADEANIEKFETVLNVLKEKKS